MLVIKLYILWILQTADAAVNSSTTAEYSNQSAAVRQKLAQLETEIQHFREENATLTRLRKEQEQVFMFREIVFMWYLDSIPEANNIDSGFHPSFVGK